MKLRVASLPFLALIALPLAAQEVKVSNERKARIDRKARPEREARKLRAAESGDLADGERESNAEPVVRMELSRYASPMVSFRPERLAPREMGEAIIILSLQRKAVFTTTSKLEVTYAQHHGHMILGNWQLDPAKPAEIESFFKGQNVHDNYAIIRVPVQVEEGTKPGKYTALFRIEANVSAGDTGQDLGRFALTANGKIEVGTSIPRPAVTVPRMSDGDRSVEVETPEPYRGPADVAVRKGVSQPPDRGITAAGHAKVDAPHAESAIAAMDEVATPADDESGFDWLLFGAPIGLLLLGVIALLARKR